MVCLSDFLRLRLEACDFGASMLSSKKTSDGWCSRDLRSGRQPRAGDLAVFDSAFFECAKKIIADDTAENTRKAHRSDLGYYIVWVRVSELNWEVGLGINPLRFLGNLGHQVLAFRNDQRGEVSVGIVQQSLDPLQMDKAGRKHMAILEEHSPQRVHELSALMDQALSPSEHHSPGLLLCGFRSDEAHFRLAGGDHDRLGISSIVLLPLDEGPNVLRSA